MKTINKNAGVLFLFLTIMLGVTSCTKDSSQANTNNNSTANLNTANLQAQINTLPIESLSSAELATVSLMREEEKLARDVYITLYNKWSANILNNISGSEQTHMDAILMLLNKYSLPDPVGSNSIGVFSNVTLQNLFTQLVAQGNTSVAEAYRVGATIEDLDINDLNVAMTSIDNQDIRLVYTSLTKGSRNHLRSFYKNILSIGSNYTPQYITQSAFDAITNSAMETGF
jgi:hypothetical protein